MINSIVGLRPLTFWLFATFFNIFSIIIFADAAGDAGSGSGAAAALDIVYAVNCGGSSHTDVNGVRYQRDTLSEGTSSDYGLRYNIQGVPAADQILYQIERYHDTTFGYDIPLHADNGDGDYVLVLQFAEVYFTRPGMKIFDVLLNHEHIVVDNLDIFKRSSTRAKAHQEIIPFRIRNGVVRVNDNEESRLIGALRIDFVKTTQDNPKCNAFYIARGDVSQIPKLPADKPPAATGRDTSAAVDGDAAATEKVHNGDDSFYHKPQAIPSASHDTLASGPPIESPYEQDKMQLLPIWLTLFLAPGLGYFVWRM